MNEVKLPHAYPFRLISSEEGPKKLTLIFSGNDSWSRGGPVPASIVLEAMTQAGGLAAASGQGRGGVLMQVVRFRCPRPVEPGDVLALSVHLLTRMGALLRVKVVARRAGRIVARGLLSLRETSS
jgi:hypothetical protein